VEKEVKENIILEERLESPEAEVPVAKQLLDKKDEYIGCNVIHKQKYGGNDEDTYRGRIKDIVKTGDLVSISCAGVRMLFSTNVEKAKEEWSDMDMEYVYLKIYK